MTPIWKMRGLSLREVGEFFGGMDYAAVAQQIRWTRVDLYKRTLAPDMDSDVIEKDYKSIDMPKVRCDFGELGNCGLEVFDGAEHSTT
jgi:hypothetical protein